MPCIKDKSTVEAIARAFCSNGRVKSTALETVGYSRKYSRTCGLKVLDNVRVKAAIARIDANVAQEAAITDADLAQMYLSLLKRAGTHDTGAAKLIAQRFDPKYVERSSHDNKHAFAGYVPALADDSRTRQRNALRAQELSLPTGIEHTPVGDTGGAVPTPALTEPQAQAQALPGHEQGKGRDMDTCTGTGQETQAKGAGGPLGG